MKRILVFSCLFAVFTQSTVVGLKPLFLESSTAEIKVQKGTRVYFLTNSDPAALRQVTVKAEKSNIDTNVYQYSVPQADGSVNPLLITGDDTVLYITKPDEVDVYISLYSDSTTKNLNVFPVFDGSSIKPKNGINHYFAVRMPDNKILTMQNVKVNENQAIKAYSPDGVQFFDSSVYKNVQQYQQLDVLSEHFYLNTILDSSVTSYVVSFGDVTETLLPAGVVMSPDFSKVQNGLLKKTYRIARSGNDDVSLHINVYFDSSIIYDTVIAAHFSGGVDQETSLSSSVQGRFNAAGSLNSIDVTTVGCYALQYYTVKSPAGPATTPAIVTTTKSSHLSDSIFSVLAVLLSLYFA